MNKYVELGGWQEGISLLSQHHKRGFGEQEQLPQDSRIRLRVMMGVVLTVSALIIARQFYLQVFSGGQHVLLSQNNHLEKIIKPAQRGNILDRNGVALTENTGETGESRKYLLGENSAHLIGYLSMVKEEEVGCREGICYTLSEWIGRTGLEKVLEPQLKGKNGGRIVEVNAQGEIVRELGSNEPESGSDVQLSIDARLQEIMTRQMKDYQGSAIALDMSGKVLGLVSLPTYDPNIFTVKQDQEKLTELLSDEREMVFFDRAIAGEYAPGSVFKPVVAYAGLMSGKIDQDTLIEDTGEIRIDQYRFGNWYFDQYGSKEGQINLERAIARSNDIFFYKVGEMVGVDEIVKWAGKFGLGELTGIELPGEVAGIVPTRIWKERATGEKWFLGNTYHLSIGQGDLMVTPLQIARMTAAAVSGRLCKVSALLNTQADCQELSISETALETVRKGMKAACSTGGTAYPFFDFTPQVLCKTGTAQHAGQGEDPESEIKPHAWITVSYPSENPKMVLTVMVEAGGEGSGVAGPIAKGILSQWRNLGN